MARKVTESSGNIFLDLGFPPHEAEVMQLRARLAEVWPDLQIVAEARNGLEAVDLVAQHRPDLVFLDIRMPGLTGVDAARQIAQMDIADDEHLPEIVFITAYDQYAVEAFEQGVADYVLKPAERERLQVTVGRIQQRLAARVCALHSMPMRTSRSAANRRRRASRARRRRPAAAPTHCLAATRPTQPPTAGPTAR